MTQNIYGKIVKQMNKKELKNHLKKHLTVDEIMNIAFTTADGQVSYKDLIDLSSHNDKQIAFKAAWVLEYAEGFSPESFLPYAKDFIRVYPNVKNYSVQRHFSKIMMRLTSTKLMSFYRLNPDAFENVLEVSFEWLLNMKTPVAVLCNVIDVVYQLSNNQDWVKDELKVILEKNLVTNSVALISRSKRLLKKMK